MKRSGELSDKERRKRRNLELEERLAEIEREMVLESRLGELNRARSVAIGTAFGGTTEITMRCNDGRTIWAHLQPVEVTEMIHQMAGNIGCHIALKPRDDFATWRQWDEDKQLIGQWPPFANDMANHSERAAIMAPPEMQPGVPQAISELKKDPQSLLPQQIAALEQQLQQLQLEANVASTETNTETVDAKNKETPDVVATKKLSNKRSPK